MARLGSLTRENSVYGSNHRTKLKASRKITSPATAVKAKMAMPYPIFMAAMLGRARCVTHAAVINTVGSPRTKSSTS